MNSARGLHLKTYVLILAMIFFGPLGNVLLGKGMKSVGNMSAGGGPLVLDFVLRVMRSGTIWLGIGSLLTFFVANLLVLSWADYSYVQPASSMAYGVVAIMAHFLLGETVTPLRWVGVGVICIGVFVIGRTPPRTTETLP